MKARKSTRKKRAPSKRINQVHANAAGIDLGSREHYVAVPEGRCKNHVRTFGCFTPDLSEMARWLKKCRIETVAMEATGVYWIPVYELLECEGFEVVLVNARNYKNVPGRKTDVQDCQWLQHLHECGLLAGSFRPEDVICVLRSYERQRSILVSQSSQHIQRMQKALDQMNLHLHKVINDISGMTGMAIIKAIIAGERDPLKLADLRNYRIRSSKAKIAKALSGNYREEHLFCLKQELEFYEYTQQKLQECDDAIENQLQSLGVKADPTDAPAAKSKSKDKHQRLALFAATGVDLTAIDGMNVQTVKTIVSEVGFDMTHWPTEKHFASWLRLCPSNKITGGRIIRSKTNPTKNRASEAFRIAAWTLSNSKSALGAYYRRIRSRKGAPHAITATAHKLARLFYRMLRYGTEYTDQGMDYYEKKYKDQLVKSARKRIESLGFNVEIKEKQLVVDAVS